MKENNDGTDTNVGSMKNSIEEDIKDIEKYISFTSKRENFSHDTDWNWNKDLANKIEHILSDYKRVLKENEEKTTILLAGAEKVKQLEKENKKLKEDRNNDIKMVALARNEVLNYMTGYEDGKKHKMTATAQVVGNQQYYIIQKQMEKYEEHIKRLQKENEELKNEVMEKDLEIIGKEEYTKDSMGEIIEQYYTANEECIPIQKVKDKIEEILNNKEYRIVFEGDAEFPDDATIINAQKYIKLEKMQELIEEREEK